MTVVLLGAVLVLAALLAFVFLVVAPPMARVAAARRTAPGEVHVSALTRAADRTTTAIEAATRGRRSPFDAEDLLLSGVAMTPSSFALVVFALSTVLALVGVLLGFGSLWAIPLAILFAALGPLVAKVVLAVRAARRRARFAEQLDDTLQLLSGNLRAGYGIVQSLDAVSRDAESPTGEEFARAVNQTRIGRDLNDALAEVAQRMRSDDFDWTAQAIAINRETGGNLSEVLQRVAATIRERNQIRRQVSALSAEGRLSAIVLVCLPVAVLAALLVIQPDYLAAFTESIIGIAAIVVALVLLVVGSVWMMLLTRVRF
jgi:Flp pilus assembly protein TadB